MMRLLFLLLKVFVFLILTFGAEAQVMFHGEKADLFFQIPDSGKVKIGEAVARIQSTPVRKKPKILFFNLHRGKEGNVVRGHAAIPFGNYAFQLMGRTKGAYEAWFSNDTMVFQPKYLKGFDAICFNNTAGILFRDPWLRQNLLDFVQDGGGFITIHAGGATFAHPKEEAFIEFGEMMGAFERGGHPWYPDETFRVKIDDPGHPLNRAFDGKGFELEDEVYQYGAPYSREKLKVLLSVDMDYSSTSPRTRILEARAADNDYALSWVKTYGKGRVFTTCLGHNPHIYWDTRILQHYLDAIQFVLGDLEASTTPGQL